MSQAFYVRAGRAGASDLSVRVPELAPLRDCTVSVFGLGALGSPAVLELAKAGLGELRVVDCDVVDPGTSVRWSLGLSVAGLPKDEVLSDFIGQNYPFTKVVHFRHRIGGTRSANDCAAMPADQEIIHKMTAGTSAILDATAEVGVQHLLSDIAREEGVTLVGVDATFGGWGGNICRIRPDGCWMCYRQACLNGYVMPPPADPNGSVQPAGCADPTFTGSSFDLGLIALTAARVVVSTLCEGRSEGYPTCDHDVITISLRAEGGGFQLPSFKGYTLTPQEGCPRCGI